VGEGGLFHADVAHNIVHILTGLLSLIFAGIGGNAAKNFCKVFGIVYLLVAIFGFLGAGESEVVSVLNIIEANMADHILHVVIALVYLGFGICKCK